MQTRGSSAYAVRVCCVGWPWCRRGPVCWMVPSGPKPLVEGFSMAGTDTGMATSHILGCMGALDVRVRSARVHVP